TVRRGSGHYSSDMSDLPSVRIHDIDNENGSFHLSAGIDDHNRVRISGHDLGPVVREVWGGSDYEYWYTVNVDQKDALLLVLLREVLAPAGLDAGTRFREL